VNQVKKILISGLISISAICLILLALANAPDLKGAGASENAFAWQEGNSGEQITVPYTLTGKPLVIRSQDGHFLLINPSPQKQFLRVTGPDGQYRIRHRMPMNMPERTGFTIETVSLTDSTVTSSFEAQAI
jgi:hypothetical protein